MRLNNPVCLTLGDGLSTDYPTRLLRASPFNDSFWLLWVAAAGLAMGLTPQPFTLSTLSDIANEVKQSAMLKRFHKLRLITPNGYLSALNSWAMLQAIEGGAWGTRRHHCKRPYTRSNLYSTPPELISHMGLSFYNNINPQDLLPLEFPRCRHHIVIAMRLRLRLRLRVIAKTSGKNTNSLQLP
jgi:hypothetical protein